MTVIAQDDHLTAGAWAACDWMDEYCLYLICPLTTIRRIQPFSVFVSVKVLDKFKEQTNRCYSSITFLKSWAYTWALTSSSFRELDNLEGQSASQWVTGINFETKQDWRPQPHPFLEKRSSLKASFHSGLAFQISRRPLPPQRWFL